jgi:plastocyanin
MERKKVAVMAILTAVVVGSFILVAAGKEERRDLKNISNTPLFPQRENTPRDLRKSEQVTVHMVPDGFSPPEIIITKGTRVTFVNGDTLWRWPASDLHPSHTLYAAFDPKAAIEPGSEWSFTFTKVGEWGTHDHLAPHIIGKVTVVE